MKPRPKQHLQKPPWLKRRLPSSADFEQIRSLVSRSGLHTVCQEARCPNIWECFSQHTATFLILGDRCTRHCRFCAVSHDDVKPPDPDEPQRVAEAVYEMGLRYVVVTSVTRDDLPDGGAQVFARTIEAVRLKSPQAKVEVLVPDFAGNPAALKTVLEAKPDVLNHNIETIKRLYRLVRPGADYKRSLELLKQAAAFDSTLLTKSGMMLGLGETPSEIETTLQDLLDAGCRMVTLGQYLQPTPEHLPVVRYLPPAEFDRLKETALELGFKEVASGPFVRSSYHAGELYQATNT